MGKIFLRLRPDRTPASGSGSFATTTPSYALPPELVERAVRQLGWVGIVYSFIYAVMYWLSFWTHRHDPFAQSSMGFYTTMMVVAVLMGIGMFLLIRSRLLTPVLMLDLGLVFQVAGGLLISIVESSKPFPPDYEIRGESSLAIWVAFFALVVPASLGKAALSSFATAAMGPVGGAINIIVNGNPSPTLSQWLMLYVAPFLMAFWAVVLSRYIYNLGKQMGKAREMGSYELNELIGRGGMGEVWKASHRMLARKAAIKLIRAEAICCTTPKEISDAKRRFEREANATAALHSPHTVALYDYGVTDDGIFYYVMELLEGLDLEGFIERFGPVTAPRVTYLLRQVCASLAEAHAYGLTHRDIKPKNIYMCRLGLSYDFIKVLDFGLVKSRATSNESRLTHDGATTGTPAYMAPEMALGHREVDARADIYALGCVGYWLLTGHLVFEAANPLSMALAHVQTQPVPPSQRTEIEVPPDLEAVIMECLQKDPMHRPQTARELDRQLAACEAASGWDNDRAEEWWRMHLPRHAQCGLSKPPAEVLETANPLTS